MNEKRTRLLILPGGPSLNQDQMESLRRHFDVIVGGAAEEALTEGLGAADIVLPPLDGEPDRLAAIAAAGESMITFDGRIVDSMNSVERLRWLEQRLVEIISGIMGFEHFEVRLTNSRTGQLELVIAVGLKPLGIGRAIFAREEGNGICGYVAATGRACLCRDVASDERYITGLESAASSLTVPLKLNERVIGVLNIESARRDAFDHEDLLVAEQLARYLAIALHVQNLLVAERCATRQKAADALNEELAGPLAQIVNDVAAIRAKLDADAETRESLVRILQSIDRAKTALGVCAAGPKSILGLEQRLRHHDAYPHLAGRTVLVADDDDSILTNMRTVLGDAGCRVAACATGAEAMEAMQTIVGNSGRIDVVISDVKLPDLNGYEIFSAARERFKGVPVILMTGFGYDPHHSIVRASQEGLQSILFKPFKAEQLLEEVNRAVQPK